MTGFIYLRLARSAAQPNPKQFSPPDRGLVWSTSDESSQEWLWGWGGAHGDVSTAQGADGSPIILSGYLTECGSTSFKKADGATTWLAQRCFNATATQLRQFVESANGSFGIFFRKPGSDGAWVATDRLASRPIWFCHEAGVLGVASHSAALAAALNRREHDLAALTSTFLYGGPVEPRKSVFQGISKLPAGTCAVFGPDGKGETVRWYKYRYRPDTDRSYSEWIELAAGRLTDAARRVLEFDSHPHVFFSGGVDSRIAAAALISGGGSPRLVTLADSENIEVRVARKAAHALKADHQVVFRHRHCYLHALRRAVFESGGSFVWTHAHFSQAAEKISDGRPDTSFVLGDFCEAFSKLCCSTTAAVAGPWNPSEFARNFDALPLPDYAPGGRSATLSFIQPDARAQAEHQLRTDLASRYETMCDGVPDPFILADQFLRWNDAGTIASFFMFLDLRSAAAERNLMFDRGVHELIETLPAAMRNGANLGARLIAKLAPRAAWVVNSNTLLPVILPPLAHRMSKRCKPLLGSARRWLLRNPYTTTGSWQSRRIRYATDPRWQAFISECLEQVDCLDQNIFSRDAIRQCWSDFLAGEHTRADDVERAVLLIEMNRMLGCGVDAYLKESSVETAGHRRMLEASRSSCMEPTGHVGPASKNPIVLDKIMP